jgi:hypothetical protein
MESTMKMTVEERAVLMSQNHVRTWVDDGRLLIWVTYVQATGYGAWEDVTDWYDRDLMTWLGVDGYDWQHAYACGGGSWLEGVN